MKLFVAFAALCGVALAAPAWTPIDVTLIDGNQLRVSLKRVDMSLRAADPSRYPMFNDLVMAGQASGVRSVTMTELEQHLNGTGSERGQGLYGAADGPSGQYASEVPAGFVFHEARVGSTLAANMLSGIPQSLVFSECGAVSALLQATKAWSRQDTIAALRTLMRALARVPGSSLMFFKFQSVLTRDIDTIIAAFPHTPWVFLYRNAIENMVSNFRGGNTGGPCMRFRNAPPAEIVALLPDYAKASSERYCAAYIAHLRQFALNALARSPQGSVLNYAAMPSGFLDVIQHHFRLPIDETVAATIAGIAVKYSKSRVPTQNTFAGDTEEKQARATDEMIAAAHEFTDAPFQQLDRLTFSRGTDAAQPDVTDATDSYPILFSLADILNSWNPDDVTIPSSYSRFSTLAVFDYSNAEELKLAQQYREAEVPFVIRNIPNVNDVKRKWTPDYLEKSMGGRVQRAESSFQNHFMYYRSAGAAAPTNHTPLSYKQWRQALNDHEHNPDKYPYVYMTASTAPGNEFINDLKIFESKQSFFVVDPRQQAGVHCRFGMAGIIAEDHWDTGRNFIAVLNGTRRYILSPPSECDKLFILKTGPSARHSSVDWSDPAVIPTLAPAQALQVVLTAGDVLYLPALWFHYIINLSPNVQCNTRSGSPDADVAVIEQCGGLKPRSSELGTADTVAERRRNLPAPKPRGLIDPEYPQSFPLQDILKHWNPDDVTIPATYGQYSSLKVFDYQTELSTALQYRDAELPFVIRNVPNLAEVGDKWTDEYLETISKGYASRTEVSTSNHFMYYHATGKNADTPTKPVKMTFPEWRQAAKVVEQNVSGPAPLYYLTMSGYSDQDWIGKDLKMFTEMPTFFVKDAQQQRGIHCRFGMPSIIAESHYDGGRNFIAMVRGKKRYILNHPNQCKKLHMMTTGMSARHSSLDWSDPSTFHKFGDATGLEVVIEAGDVLYLPALWFHYIVSLETNVQCNTRSGTPGKYADDIRKCGFSVFVSEGSLAGRLKPLESESEVETKAEDVSKTGSARKPQLEDSRQTDMGTPEYVNGSGYLMAGGIMVGFCVVIVIVIRRRMTAQPFQLAPTVKRPRSK